MTSSFLQKLLGSWRNIRMSGYIYTEGFYKTLFSSHGFSFPVHFISFTTATVLDFNIIHDFSVHRNVYRETQFSSFGWLLTCFIIGGSFRLILRFDVVGYVLDILLFLLLLSFSFPALSFSFSI